ncbi:hypothetical protein [Pacificibacter marinus]|uniref:hypothetical protein n=1 Tax=Pacificibacter marinus TaxID=658057 RepID=UPI001C06BBAC|nr:hypothetical protein [Pacificibacter marinus]MBU2868280.1 hypothetical protein [Pacificibacter marinus]
MKKLNFLKSFPFGVFIGLEIAILFCWILDSSLRNEIKQNLIQLLTISVTLLAAGIATLGVFHTVDQQEIHRREERNNRLNAARALLPHSLASLNTVVENGIKYSKTYCWNDWKIAHPDYLDEISISEEVFQNLKECIEHSDELAARWLTLAISRYQVCHSRLRSRPQDFSEVENGTMVEASYATYIAEQFADWLLLKQIVGVLFDFSRGNEALPNQIAANAYTLPLGDEPTGISELALEKITARISGNRLTLTALER